MSSAPSRQSSRPRATTGVRTAKRLRRADLPTGTEALARHLLGKLIVRRLGAHTASVRIVETEAYLPGDAACHAYRGPTPRNRSLFLAPGHAYVYLCYGVSWLLNVSSEPEGIGSGVLLRAAEPVSGLALLSRDRPDERPEDLCKGPGRLTRALQVDSRFDGADLLSGRDLWLAQDGVELGDAAVSVRIGITKAAELPLRFFVRGSESVSGSRRINSLPPLRTRAR
jgi:DNA-3-methyladenine glycosylase